MITCLSFRAEKPPEGNSFCYAVPVRIWNALSDKYTKEIHRLQRKGRLSAAALFYWWCLRTTYHRIVYGSFIPVSLSYAVR